MGSSLRTMWLRAGLYRAKIKNVYLVFSSRRVPASSKTGYDFGEREGRFFCTPCRQSLKPLRQNSKKQVTKISLSASSQIAKPSHSRTGDVPHFQYLGIFCNLFCESSPSKEGYENSLMRRWLAASVKHDRSVGAVKLLNCVDTRHSLCLPDYWLKNKLIPEDSGAHTWVEYSCELCDWTSECRCVLGHARAHSLSKIISCSEDALQWGASEHVRVARKVVTFSCFLQEHDYISSNSCEFCKTTASQFVLIIKWEKDSQVTSLNPRR